MVVQRIKRLRQGGRQSPLVRLVILAGLRKTLGKMVKEARKVPILNDILDHEVIGLRSRRESKMGKLKILRRQIKKRFGTVPNWGVERLVKLSAKGSKS